MNTTIQLQPTSLDEKIRHIKAAAQRPLSTAEIITAARVKPTDKWFYEVDLDYKQELAISMDLRGDAESKASFMSHYIMALCCMAYLLLEDWVHIFKDPGRQAMLHEVRHGNQIQFSFYDYAAMHWYVHVQKLSELSDSEVDEEKARHGAFLRHELRRPIAALCEIGTGRMRSWFMLYQGERQDPLEWASARGLEPIVQGLLDNHYYEGLFRDSAKRSSEFVALGLAAERGHDSVIKTLLRNLEVEFSAQAWGQLILTAAQNGHLSTVQLLDGIAFKLGFPYFGNHALVAACRENHISVAEFLLNSDVSARATDGKDTALSAAVKNWHKSPVSASLISLLLQKGANPLCEALFVAAAEGAVDVLRRLLEATDEKVFSLDAFRTVNRATEHALNAGQGITFSMLASFAATGYKYPWGLLQWALEAAASRGDDLSVQAFLDFGAEDKDAVALGWMTKMHRHRTAIQQLLKTQRYTPPQLSAALGLLFNVPTRSIILTSRKPFDHVECRHCIDQTNNVFTVPHIAMDFMEHGPLLDFGKYLTMVETTLRQRNFNASLLILNRALFTGDYKSEDYIFRNFLPKLCLQDPEVVLSILKDSSYRIDVNARDMEGMTLLLAAAINNHTGLCRELLTRGANPNAFTHYTPTSGSNFAAVQQPDEHYTPSLTPSDPLDDRLATCDTGESELSLRQPFHNFYGSRSFIDSPLALALSRHNAPLTALLLRAPGANPWSDYSTTHPPTPPAAIDYFYDPADDPDGIYRPPTPPSRSPPFLSSVLHHAARTRASFRLFTAHVPAGDDALSAREEHSGKTLLHWVARHANLVAARALLQGVAGVDPNARDGAGRTPLHELAAARLADGEAVRFAVWFVARGGADVGARDGEGRTAAGVAGEGQVGEVLRAVEWEGVGAVERWAWEVDGDGVGGWEGGFGEGRRGEGVGGLDDDGEEEGGSDEGEEGEDESDDEEDRLSDWTEWDEVDKMSEEEAMVHQKKVNDLSHSMSSLEVSYP